MDEGRSESADLQVARAQYFLEDIRQFSAAYLPTLGLPANGSGNGGPRLDHHGIVLHYTVDESAPSVLRWLCSEQSEASAHFVIAQDRLATPMDFGPEASARNLPASIVQLRPLDCTAWHATWANRWAFGVEICNAGEIRQDATGLNHVYRSGKGWTPSSSPYVQNALHAGSRAFCGYSDAQLYSLKLLLHALCKAYHIPVARIFGHDNVQGRATPASGAHDKRDVGPAFDLDAMREFVINMTGCDFDAAYDQARLENPVPPRFDEQKMFRGIMPESQDDWALRCAVKAGDTDAACQLLWDLNYYVECMGTNLSIDQDQIATFQKMMGLLPDGLIGPKTRAAICLRHADRLCPAPIVTTGDQNA